LPNYLQPKSNYIKLLLQNYIKLLFNGKRIKNALNYLMLKFLHSWSFLGDFLSQSKLSLARHAQGLAVDPSDSA
jgi:hypothetical protein